MNELSFRNRPAVGEEGQGTDSADLSNWIASRDSFDFRSKDSGLVGIVSSIELGEGGMTLVSN